MDIFIVNNRGTLKRIHLPKDQTISLNDLERRKWTCCYLPTKNVLYMTRSEKDNPKAVLQNHIEQCHTKLKTLELHAQMLQQFVRESSEDDYKVNTKTLEDTMSIIGQHKRKLESLYEEETTVEIKQETFEVELPPGQMSQMGLAWIDLSNPVPTKRQKTSTMVQVRLDHRQDSLQVPNGPRIHWDQLPLRSSVKFSNDVFSETFIVQHNHAYVVVRDFYVEGLRTDFRPDPKWCKSYTYFQEDTLAQRFFQGVCEPGCGNYQVVSNGNLLQNFGTAMDVIRNTQITLSTLEKYSVMVGLAWALRDFHTHGICKFRIHPTLIRIANKCVPFFTGIMEKLHPNDKTHMPTSFEAPLMHGPKGAANHTADQIFSLGMVFYALLNGFPGCETDSFMLFEKWNHKYQKGQIPLWNIESKATVPVPLRDLIDQMRQPKPEDRVSSAEEVLQSLVRTVDPQAVQHLQRNLGKPLHHNHWKPLPNITGFMERHTF